MAAGWDLTALANAADPKAPPPERHLWLVRLMEWLRHAPQSALPAAATAQAEPQRTPLPATRLRHLLNQLERQQELGERVRGVARAFWAEIDAAALLADFGFGARRSFGSELLRRIQARLLPGTPDTMDLAALFRLLFEPGDAAWVEALDRATLDQAARLLGPGPAFVQGALLDAITILVSTVQAAGYAPALRLRMEPALLRDEPFRQLSHAADALRTALTEGRAADALQAAAYLRALLDRCRRAAASVMPHLEQYGVSVNIVFDLDQLQGRTLRIEQLVNCVLAPDPVDEGRRLWLELLRALAEQSGLRALLARHYSLLARQVAERSAETGEHYITRSRDEYRDMLRRAAGGGAVIAGTTFAKFAIAAIGLSAFWTGFWSGANYAASFVVVMLLHWTVATKQPAMTAPAMAASLPVGSEAGDAEIEAFVDRVAQLIRSQMAGIVGNLLLCGPLVLAVQLVAVAAFGVPLVGEKDAHYVLHSLTLLGPTALYAAFTGVLLFASSLIAGWAENWFVFHRLDSALAWNPRIVARLGAARARRWSAWWRQNVSGVAANVSLGLMLGLMPALLGFVGLPIEVRHVTLSTGQLGAALGALGWQLLAEPAFWWCVAGIAATGVLNLTVSFWLAFRVALRSRGVRLHDRDRITAALWRRLRREPGSFLRPPREAS
ncbi:Recombinase [Rubrivivax sp. A210]|uniref:site-specific recombinase n=1 Tax=Rubrivivax sp. A210 TaxID=2772301 RepID=UPI00191857E8|nr:recombinase [Rubrivivax sp. A210]CAD5374990.1 Recombinase [Rubrivivax sp. A210]